MQTYSRILFDQAKNTKSLEQVFSDLTHLVAIIENSTNLLRYLSAPIYTDAEKKELLSGVLKKLKPAKITQNFLDVIIENNKMEYLPSIYKDFSQRIMDSKGQVEANIITAKKISSKDLKSLTDMFEKKLGKKFVVTHEIDPSIIGGAILNYGSNMLDLSIINMQNKLNRDIHEV